MSRPDASPAEAAPRVIAAGPWNQREFATAAAEVDAERNWTYAPSVEDAVELLERQTPPAELALLAQPYPGYYRSDAALRLQTAAPLVRPIVVAGTWCEGEMRTGAPLEGAIRLYWHELAPWWRAAVALWAAGDRPPWSRPLDEARIASWSDRRRTRPSTNASDDVLRVLVASDDEESYAAIAAALKPESFDCHRFYRGRVFGSGPPSLDLPEIFDAGVWNGGGLDDAELAHAAEFAKLFGGNSAPVIALVDLPHAEDVSRLESIGVAGLLGKPYSVGALIERICWAVAASVAASKG